MGVISMPNKQAPRAVRREGVRIIESPLLGARLRTLTKNADFQRRDTHCQNVYRKSFKTLAKPVRSEGLDRQG
jgi:hypothetical protein